MKGILEEYFWKGGINFYRNRVRKFECGGVNFLSKVRVREFFK